ncbi:MAG: flavodoxin domain-containing protein [Bacillales bacterium]
MENKSIIYYKSNTGFSKMYAEILKPRIEASLILDIKNIKKKDFINYKNIIFIGPLRNNNILGLKKFLKKYKSMKNKNIFVLAVGMEQETSEKREIVINMNRLHKYHLRLYFLMGGFNFNKLSNFKKKY